MTPRREFPESVKRAAMERAAVPSGQPRCQDPQCGISAEWTLLIAKLDEACIQAVDLLWNGPDESAGASHAELILLRDAILAKRFMYPRVLKPIIKRFRLDGGALLEVDHERECADGGEPTLDNAIVGCVFCHFFKTRDREAHRARAPKMVNKVPTFHGPVTKQPLAARSGKPTRVEGLRAAIATVGPKVAEAQAERRHYSEAEWSRRMREKALAVQQDDGFFGA